MVVATLLAVLASPPLTSGERTRRRLQVACRALGFSSFVVHNLVMAPTRSILDISVVASDESAWVEARARLAAALEDADGVLLGFGVSSPVGPARVFYLAQVRWLMRAIASHGLPTWQVGDGPRHPSRWQRWTARHHAGVPFAVAMEDSLQAVDVETLEGTSDANCGQVPSAPIE